MVQIQRLIVSLSQGCRGQIKRNHTKPFPNAVRGEPRTAFLYISEKEYANEPQDHKKVDESPLTTLCAVCRGAFLDAKDVRLRRADPRQLVKDVCTYCQTRYGFDYYELYKQYGCERYVEMLHIINEAWKGNVDAYLAGVIRGVARFISVYEGEYSRERLVQQLARTHPKTITQLAQKDTGSSANRHMRQILRIYNGASREMSLPLKN